MPIAGAKLLTRDPANSPRLCDRRARRYSAVLMKLTDCVYVCVCIYRKVSARPTPCI